ncbi:MAG TPA: VCBS repeat-containing protein [Acidobacteriaceae bacterium]|jgi:hypothetical protein|nr:VCBS repeat-containing protein [Acidobacteriaceae bacterium]
MRSAGSSPISLLPVLSLPHSKLSVSPHGNPTTSNGFVCPDRVRWTTSLTHFYVVTITSLFLMILTMLLLSDGLHAQALFQLPTASTTLSTGTTPQGIAVADFAHSGYQSLVVANEASNSLSVYLGNGPGTFSAPTTVPTCTGPTAITTADFNNDSYPDIAIVCPSAAVAEIFLNNQAGGFGTPTSITVPASPVALVAGDFNSDGYVDLAVANTTSNS